MVLLKKEATTDPALGRDPNRLPMEELIEYGVVNIDKPAGPTSHQTSDYVQRVLHLKKAGHSGSLDPGVTGVLPVALGKATRLTNLLLKSSKEYIGVMHIHQEVDEAKVRAVVTSFIGKITQLPPIRSSVKRQLRERTIYAFDILEIEGQDVLFRVECQAGTYIRKLCHDLGIRLGVGAHMAELRRTKAGPFTEQSTLVTLQDLADAYHYWKSEGNEKYLHHCIQPAETALGGIKKIWIFDSTVSSLCYGRDLAAPGLSKLDKGITIGETIALMTLKDELVALAEARMTSQQILEAEKGIVAKTSKVFMDATVYKEAAPTRENNPAG